jgi:hypothetical protein
MELGGSTGLFISYGRVIKSRVVRTVNADELIPVRCQKQDCQWHLGRARPKWQDMTKAKTIHVARQGICTYVMAICLLKRSSSLRVTYSVVSHWVTNSEVRYDETAGLYKGTAATDYMKQTPSSETSWVLKKFPYFTRPKGSLPIHRCPPPVPILSQINPANVHILFFEDQF